MFSGGSSVGERDLIVDVVAARGEMMFHGIAVKPGKPTASRCVARHAVFRDARQPDLVPVQRVRVAPAVPSRDRALAAAGRQNVRVPLGRRIVSQAGRLQFYTVRLDNGVAIPAFKGSGEITSLSQADGYIQIPPDQAELEEGSFVDVTLF